MCCVNRAEYASAQFLRAIMHRGKPVIMYLKLLVISNTMMLAARDQTMP